MLMVLQRYRQTHGQTYDSNTALALCASHGKKGGSRACASGTHTAGVQRVKGKGSQDSNRKPPVYLRVVGHFSFV